MVQGVTVFVAVRSPSPALHGIMPPSPDVVTTQMARFQSQVEQVVQGAVDAIRGQVIIGKIVWFLVFVFGHSMKLTFTVLSFSFCVPIAGRDCCSAPRNAGTDGHGGERRGRHAIWLPCAVPSCCCGLLTCSGWAGVFRVGLGWCGIKRSAAASRATRDAQATEGNAGT